MRIPLNLWLAASFAFAQDHGEEESEEMGPIAFMWPADRTWGAAFDNTGPCGSVDQVVNRTEFPMLNGQIALVMQDDAWKVEVSISHQNAPESNDDFEAVKSTISDLDPGHMCYPIPNPPADVDVGSNATIQLKYTADFETNRNETYYACADIYYVTSSDFQTQVPCFNVSSDDFDAPDAASDDATSSSTASAPVSTADASETEASSTTSDSSLSGGAIAGIVIAALAALAIIAAFFFFWGRKKQREKRRQQEESVRAVQWKEDTRSSQSGSRHENGDIALRDM